jgi:hypothetical protein
VHANDADRARAQQLFDDAKLLMEQGKYADACPKLAESQQLDPADGTLLRYAWCEEELGKLATAWVLFKDGLARAKKSNNPQRITFATEHLAAIEPKLSKVTIHVSAEATIDGLEVRWDGTLLGMSEWNSEFPVDSGNHTLSAAATGRQTWTTTIGVGANGDRRTVEIPLLLASPTSSSAAVDEGTSGKKTPTMAYVLGGAGIVLVGATVFARIEAGSAADDRKTACLAETTPTCDDTGKSKVRTWEAVSFVTGGLALASIGVAVYLFASPMKSESPPPQAYVRVVPTIGGVSLQGAF